MATPHARSRLLVWLLAAVGCATLARFGSLTVLDAVPVGPSTQTPPARIPACDFVSELPAVLPDDSETITLMVPVRNHHADTVRFGTPICDCACTTCEFASSELRPGDETTLRMAVRVSGKFGPQRFTCRWSDDAGRSWSATAAVTICPTSQFEPAVIDLGTVRPAAVLTACLSYVQHWRAEEAEPPPPQIDPTDPGARVVLGEPVLARIGDGVTRRTTPVTVTATSGADAGAGLTTVTVRHPVPASAAVRWHVPTAVSVVPERLVFRPDETERTARVRWRDGIVPSDVSARASSPAVEVRLADGVLHVRRVGPPPAEPASAEIVLDTRPQLADHPPVRIPVVLLPRFTAKDDTR